MGKVTVDAVCKSCSGTGVYQGFAEAPGIAVVCMGCGGTGCEKLTYTPFKKRSRRNGVKFVQRSRGNLLVTGVGGVGEQVAYEDFLAGKMPSGR